MELLYTSNFNLLIKKVIVLFQIKTMLELFNITVDNNKAKLYIKILI